MADRYLLRLLDGYRIYALTEQLSWFIRIYDELDAKEMASHEWLKDAVAPPSPISPGPAAAVTDLEQQRRLLTKSTYLHEYCHFVQIAACPYYAYLQTLQHCQTWLTIRLARELGEPDAGDLPLRDSVRARAASDPRFRRLDHRYVVPWEACEAVIRAVEQSDGDDLDITVRFAEADRALAQFERRFNPGLGDLLLRLIGRDRSIEPAEWGALGRPQGSLHQPRAISRQGGTVAPFGARAIAESAATVVQIAYIAGVEGWRPPVLEELEKLVEHSALEPMAVALESERFRALDRYTKLLTFLMLCDVALQSPLHPLLTGLARNPTWEDLHPGHRFRRAVALLDQCGVPSPAIDVDALLGLGKRRAELLPPLTFEAHAALVRGDKEPELRELDALEEELCRLAGWGSPFWFSRAFSEMGSPRVDFVTRLRAEAHRLRLRKTAVTLMPFSAWLHGALQPPAIFVGKDFRSSPLSGAGEVDQRRLITNHLAGRFARQLMTAPAVDLYGSDSIVESWLVSREQAGRIRDTFRAIFRIDPASVDAESGMARPRVRTVTAVAGVPMKPKTPTQRTEILGSLLSFPPADVAASASRSAAADGAEQVQRATGETALREAVARRASGSTLPNALLERLDSCGRFHVGYEGAKQNPLVVHIECAASFHLPYETNTVWMLSALYETYPFRLVCVEGAVGIVDTAWVKAFPDPKIRKEVALGYLHEGTLRGEEFFAIAGDEAFLLFGVDNPHFRSEIEKGRDLWEQRARVILRTTLETMDDIGERVGILIATSSVRPVLEKTLRSLDYSWFSWAPGTTAESLEPRYGPAIVFEGSEQFRAKLREMFDEDPPPSKALDALLS